MDGQKLKQEQLSTKKTIINNKGEIYNYGCNFSKKINMMKTYDNDISTKLSSKREKRYVTILKGDGKSL